MSNINNMRFDFDAVSIFLMEDLPDENLIKNFKNMENKRSQVMHIEKRFKRKIWYTFVGLIKTNKIDYRLMIDAKNNL